MGWNPTTKILTAPISLGDISTAVQKASDDLGTLCQAAGINKWAKFKPTRATGVITPTDYWKGRSNDNPQTCALTLPIVVTSNTPLQTFMQNLAGGSYSWTHLYPRGMAKDPEEWFRALDFDGYDGRSVCPLPAPPSGVYTYSTMRTFICDLLTQVTAGLSLDDLTSTASGSPLLSSYYIGLLLYKGTTRHWCTATVPINDPSEGRGSATQKHLKVAFNLSGMTGDWNCRTFLCSTALTQDQVPSDSTARWLIACEGEETISLVHLSGDYAVTISGKWISSSQYKVEAHFINGKDTPVTVTNMKLVLAFGPLDIRTIDIGSSTLSVGEDWPYMYIFNYVHQSGDTATVSGNFGGTTKSATMNLENS